VKKNCKSFIHSQSFETSSSRASKSESVASVGVMGVGILTLSRRHMGVLECVDLEQRELLARKVDVRPGSWAQIQRQYVLMVVCPAFIKQKFIG